MALTGWLGQLPLTRWLGQLPLISDPWFYAVAIPAVLLTGLSKSGFDAAKVDATFWSGTPVKTNFLSTLGHGDPAKVLPRSPRLSFEQACQFA